MQPIDLALVVLALVLGAVVGHLAAVVRRPGPERAVREELARARAELVAEQRISQERLTALGEDHERVVQQFRTLAADALAANNEQFLALAEQRLTASAHRQDAVLAGREQAVRTLVEPIATVLDEMRAQVGAAEQARAAGEAALAEQVRGMRETSEGLRTETGRLVTALRSSQVRGRWGELQLRRVVEAAGMLDHVDFVEQRSVRTADGHQRPDMLIRLSGGRHVVLDAKVALAGYLDAVETDQEAVRKERMAAHARHVRKHVDDLSAKQYWEQFSPAPEFVVMFVPAEPVLQAALEADTGLQEYAMERNVVLATPMTLVALLRTVAYTWRQDALAANAQQVLTLGRELHGRLATLGAHVSRLGRQLDGAVRAYNDSVSSLETRVLVSARRLADLGLTDADLEPPVQLDRVSRQVQAPELLPRGDAAGRGLAPFEDLTAVDDRGVAEMEGLGGAGGRPDGAAPGPPAGGGGWEAAG